jgi:hypothetical protein
VPLLVPLAQPKELRGGAATAAGGLPAGAPAAVHCGGEAGEERSSGGATWYGERDGVVGSGGGRTEAMEQRWPWSLAGRPWRRRAPVT